jgi:hypothetical protein
MAAKPSPISGKIHFKLRISWLWDSNPGPTAYKAVALPTELSQREKQPQTAEFRSDFNLGTADGQLNID